MRWIVSAHRRSEPVGRAVAAIDAIAKCLTVDRQAQRTADAHIIKGFTRSIETVKICAEVRLLPQRCGILFFHQIHHLGSSGISDVELTVAKHPRLGEGVGDRQETYAVERHVFRAPIVRIALYLDVVVAHE